MQKVSVFPNPYHKIPQNRREKAFRSKTLSDESLLWLQSLSYAYFIYQFIVQYHLEPL